MLLNIVSMSYINKVNYYKHIIIVVNVFLAIIKVKI